MATSRKAMTPAQIRARKKNDVVELPSGITMRLKRPGMARFLEAGFLPDSLASMVKREIAAAKGGRRTSSEKDLMESLKEEDILEMVSVMDRIVVECIAEPEVRWHQRVCLTEDPTPQPKLDAAGREVLEEIPEGERDESVLYTDEVDQEDKNFIFQYAVGGSPDLARFRASTNAFVAAVSTGGDVEHASEQVAAP